MSTSEKDTTGKFSPKTIAARVGRFFKDLKGEMKKVVWPSRKQVINNTAIVILFVLVAALVIGGIDGVFSMIVNFVFKSA